MRRLATLAVVAALISPVVASGQNYTFGDWARDQGYSPGDVMPEEVRAWNSGIDSLDGIGEFDWTTTPTTQFLLSANRISRIESGDFSELTNLTELRIESNRISRIESGAFSELTNLRGLGLGVNTALTELNLVEADFLSLADFNLLSNVNITSVSLRNAVLNQTSLASLLDGGDRLPWLDGIGELDAVIAKMDLSGIDFVDITDLEPLYVMDDLTDLWLVNTQNVDATELDALLDNLETIEGTDIEGILYLTEADFEAFNTAGGGLLAVWDAEPGHHVEYLQIGDVNHNTEVNGLDVEDFTRVLLAGRFDVAADMNGDGVVNGLDVDPFVAAVIGGNAEPIPEPSTFLLCVVALGVVGGMRKWSG